MAKKQIDLGLTGLDELFMDDKERAESKLPKIHEIPLSEIDEFPNHPFHVRLDEAMDQLVESNLQRTTILPSEKAFSYKMRLEAMNRQGQRTDLTSVPLGQKLGKTSREVLADSSTDSNTQIQRYIRLTHLIPPLLDLVDSGKIAFRPAVELSYLTEEEQNSLLDSINSEQSTPSLAQASKMKEFSQNGRLNADVILSIMCEQKPNQKEKISFQSERLKPFIPKNFTAKQAEDYVIKALEYYHRYQLRQKERDR